MSLADDLKYYGITQKEICVALDMRDDFVSRALSDNTRIVRDKAQALIQAKRLEFQEKHGGIFREVHR